MKLRAHAKINLDLLVTGRREDGYHDLSTVMCELPLFDTVRMFIHPLKPKTAYKTPAPLKADQEAPAVAKANQDAPAISKANQEASVPSKILWEGSAGEETAQVYSAEEGNARKDFVPPQIPNNDSAMTKDGREVPAPPPTNREGLTPSPTIREVPTSPQTDQEAPASPPTIRENSVPFLPNQEDSAPPQTNKEVPAPPPPPQRDPAGEVKVVVRCSDESLPRDEKNVAGKAAAAFFDALRAKYSGDMSRFLPVFSRKIPFYTPKILKNPQKSSVKEAARGVEIRINIQKRIPQGAGLGGGSADAAAVLRGLNAFFDAFSYEELHKIADGVGADVPFCLTGGAALCTGRGEKMIPLKKLSNCYILLVKPPQNLSTAEVFRKYDEINPRVEYTHENLLKALENKDISGVRHLQNDLYLAASAFCPKIETLITELKKAGAAAASMTGSGSAVFGIFSNKKAAKKEKKRIQNTDKKHWLTLLKMS